MRFYRILSDKFIHYIIRDHSDYSPTSERESRENRKRPRGSSYSGMDPSRPLLRVGVNFQPSPHPSSFHPPIHALRVHPITCFPFVHFRVFNFLSSYRSIRAPLRPLGQQRGQPQ